MLFRMCLQFLESYPWCPQLGITGKKPMLDLYWMSWLFCGCVFPLAVWLCTFSTMSLLSPPLSTPVTFRWPPITVDSTLLILISFYVWLQQFESSFFYLSLQRYNYLLFVRTLIEKGLLREEEVGSHWAKLSELSFPGVMVSHTHTTRKISSSALCL